MIRGSDVAICFRNSFRAGPLRLTFRKYVLGALVAAALVVAPPAAADGTINDFQTTGQLELPFYGYLYRNGFGYLDAQQALSDGAFACVQDLNGVPLDEVISLVQTRGNSADEAQAIVFAMQKANNSDAYEPFCSAPSTASSTAPVAPPPVGAAPSGGIGVDMDIPYVNVPYGCTWVDGYTRSNGTYVNGHIRC